MCVEVYCSVLQCATVCLQSGDNEASAGDSGNARSAQQSHSYLQQCVAVCCSVLQWCLCVGKLIRHNKVTHVCCSVVQCDTASRIVVQCVAVRCNDVCDSVYYLRYAAPILRLPVWYSVMQWDAQYHAVCCSVCASVCDAVWCSVCASVCDAVRCSEMQNMMQCDVVCVCNTLQHI